MVCTAASFIGLMAVYVLTAVLLNSSLLECFTVSGVKKVPVSQSSILPPMYL
jgi:hypothetical protein